MKKKLEIIINERLSFLREEDIASLTNEIYCLLKEMEVEKDRFRVLNKDSKDENNILRKQNEVLKNENEKSLKEIEILKEKLILLNSELKNKFSKAESKTIAYLLGESIIESVKNPKEGIRNIPKNTSFLVKQTIQRRSKKKSTSKVDRILGVLFDSNETILIEQPKLINEKSISDTNKENNDQIALKEISYPRTYINIKKDYVRISYDYGKNLWPSKSKEIKFISVLDEISETSWSEEFQLYQLNRNNFSEQIPASNSNGLFIESCWLGNQGKWEYAFTSPGLKHQNAQDLLKALDLAKVKCLPILFWNKEDPMHYEKFLPIAKKSDIIFTTDSNKIDNYIKDLGHNRVFCLPFAANPYICNPMNRSRYSEENICFAGSYYSVGHDERKQQMDNVLPALLKLDGVIYDRMSKLNNERYYFPTIYREIIRDSVNFKDMTALYKHFKIFLNVNTITNSPSMMSRRVYELLACGTVVISTPSKALEEQFPEIVKIANNAQEAENIARNLLNNPWEYSRLAHLGYREVMLHHTYENRKNIILSALNINSQKIDPLVSIILPTMRPYFIDRIINNIGKQTYKNIECIIITQNYSETQVKDLKTKLDSLNNIGYKVIENNNADNLGARLNQALTLAKGEYIAKFDDDDLYFPNYLTDMLLPFKFGNWSIVGKKEGFFYLEKEDKLIVKYPNQRHINTDFIMGATMIIKRKDLIEVGGFLESSKGEDSNLLQKMKESGKNIYATDPFNFIVWRSKEAGSHSWEIDKIFFERNCEYVGQGLMKDIVQI